MLHYQSLLFVPKTIWMKLITRYHNNLVVDYFGIEKTYKLLVSKYYWPLLRYNVEAYVKGCDVCLA